MGLKAAVSLYFERNAQLSTGLNAGGSSVQPDTKLLNTEDVPPASGPGQPEPVRPAPPLPSPAWGDAAEAVQWFLSSEPPGKPFVLWEGDPPGRAFVTVLHPESFWRRLRGDVLAGPGVGRDTWGAVRADVLRLYELFASRAGGQP